MESNKNLMLNKAMFWGLIIALASMIVTTIYYSTDSMFSKSASWVSILIYVVGIVLATLSYKKSIDDETPFPYSKALGLGVSTMFFASLILAIFTFVLYKIIDPGLIDEMISFTENKLLESGISEDMIEKQIEMQRKFMTPAILSLSEVFTVVIYGLIISLITSIFLKKKTEDGFNAAMHEIDNEE
jgi:hypothetical protein